MKWTYSGALFLAPSLALVLAGLAGAQSAENRGARDLYLRYCGDCHGTSGRGDGAAAAALQPAPADLTRSTLSRDEVIRVIDGRRPVNGHGAPSMPQWGALFENQGGILGRRASEIRITALADEVLGLREAAVTPKARAPSER